MNEEKILTREVVKELGLDKVNVITSNMLKEYTSIGSSAFSGCSSLTSIILPNSVTSIGYGAFGGCSSLTSITIPNSVTSIGDYSFDGCSSLTSVILPNSITGIGNGMFRNCNSLNSIVIPNSVTSIGSCSFDGCSSLTSVILPNSVTSIGNFVFYGCSSITSITIPTSITSIGRCTFNRCNKLKSVIIGDKIYETKVVNVNGKYKAYKAFNSNMTCRGFQYEEGKTYEIDGELELCKRGFHSCLNFLDVFNYYSGEIGKDIVVHEVEIQDVSFEIKDEDSKVVAKKITIGKRIL